MEVKNQGILLQSVSYLGTTRILKVFTEESGLITLMAKKAPTALVSPFCIAEWVYRKKQSEIFSLIDGALIDGLLALRQSYAALIAAGRVAQDILKTQLPGKSAPNLYRLAASYFKKIGTFKTPETLALSFRLKLLLHEGLLALQEECAHCMNEATGLSQGESVCQKHAMPGSVEFSIPEWRTLHQLAFSRSFALLEQTSHSAPLENKIASLS